MDDYIDLLLPWLDAKVASKLCIGGGPCKYVLKDGGSSLCDDWLLDNVVLNILQCFEKEVALVLSLPLLWAVFYNDRPRPAMVPAAVRMRIRTVYAAVGNRELPLGEKPVKKVALVVTGWL